MEVIIGEALRKVSLKTKLSFSSGALEEAMFGAAGIATMIFYNQVQVVGAALCGLLNGATGQEMDRDLLVFR